MHPVLQNPFLLGEIFERLSEGLGAGGNFQCYDASLVCHAFRDPAQNILWRKLSSIGPLLRLLPAFKFEETSRTWIFEGGGFTALDLATLLRFGRRVRVLDLSCGECECDNDDTSVPIILANALAGQPLLPNLQHLDFSQSHRGKNYSTGWLNLLQSSNLRSVHLRYDGDGEEAVINLVDYSSFISRLSKESSLHIFGAHGFLPTEAAQRAVGSFRSLSTLSLTLPISYGDFLDWAFFSSITALQNLRSLEILHLKFGGAVIKPGRKIELGGLQRLAISCTFSTALELLQTIQLPALQGFRFLLRLFGEKIGVQFLWTEFFKAMSVSFGPEFTRLEMYESAITHIERDVFHSYTGVPFSSISYLLLPMHLRELILIVPIVKSISIDDLYHMSEAWPTLTTLELWTSSPTSAPDTSALTLIAERFPRLEDLSLRVNMANIIEPPGTTSSHKLRHIYLRPVNLAKTKEAEMQLASLLDALFPYLKRASLDHGSLFRHIYSLQEARKRERYEKTVEDVQGNVGMEG